MSSTLTDGARRSAPSTRPLQTPADAPAHDPHETTDTRERARLPWWHLALRALKGLFLLAELCAVLFLTAYAGLFQMLPRNPPPLHVLAPGYEVTAHQSAYCWLTPGRAVCADAAPEDPPLTALPAITTPSGAMLRLTMAYPAPTRCTSTANATSGASKPLAQALASTPTRPLSAVTYRLGIALQPGTYRVTIACQWTPNSAMRWLRGLGDSTYDIALHVVPR
jgi:hypothetical protein